MSAAPSETIQASELQSENRALKQALAEREARLVDHQAKLIDHQAQLADHQAKLIDRETQLTQHLSRIAELEHQIETLLCELKSAAYDKHKLEARLKELLRQRRALTDALAPGQLTLLFGAEQQQPSTPPCVNEAPDGETKEDPIRPRHRRTNEPRKIAYAALPREHVHHELGLAQRVCPMTGKELVAIGEKTTEELEYRPAKLVLVVHHRAVYGLNEEDRKERTIEPVVTPEPPRAIEDALAGPGLLAWILLQKYGHHLPLYRQQAIFAREGLELPRQTMCDWVIAAAFNLGPIQRALRKQILSSGVLQLDDTPIQCQGGRGQENFQAHLWTYLSPQVDGVVFDFTPSRGHEHVLEFLEEDFVAGYLVGDGFSGYGTIAGKRPGVLQAGCWAHVLRKFRDALKEAPAEASSMMSLIAQLFDIEEAAIERKLAPDAVHALRAERSRPVIVRIREKAESLRHLGSETGSMHEATRYILNQWPTLERFLEDGRVPIHNNSCESSIRPIAVGRRNWLFAGSERGGHAAATIYTLIETCRRVGLDPYLYLRDVLLRVATHPANKVDQLTPASWKQLFASAQSL